MNQSERLKDVDFIKWKAEWARSRVIGPIARRLRRAGGASEYASWRSFDVG